MKFYLSILKLTYYFHHNFEFYLQKYFYNFYE